MSYEKCPNCGAPTILSPSGNIAICEYCDSEFAIEVSAKKVVVDNKLPAEQLFDFSNIEAFENNHALESAEQMCAWINDGDTVETCLEGLKEFTSKYDTEWALEECNTALFDKIRPKVQEYMSADEKMLFYKDSGVFSTGKSGTLITDKHIFCISKKRIEKLALAEIYSIHATSLSWYFNANKNIEIDNMVCTRAEQGIIMALICLLVQRHKGYGCQIKVYNGVY